MGLNIGIERLERRFLWLVQARIQGFAGIRKGFSRPDGDRKGAGVVDECQNEAAHLAEVEVHPGRVRHLREAEGEAIGLGGGLKLYGVVPQHLANPQRRHHGPGVGGVADVGGPILVEILGTILGDVG